MIQVDLKIPDSFLLICPQCFDCWARLKGTDSNHWWHRYVPCLDHTFRADAYGGKLGGSLLEADEAVNLTTLPPELLSQELSLYLEDSAPCV